MPEKKYRIGFVRARPAGGREQIGEPIARVVEGGAHAASFSAMVVRPGTLPAGPSTASVGLARNRRAAARQTSSVRTASILATISFTGMMRPKIWI